MADCYYAALEMDDLHRRWLPREILADIGIADATAAAADGDDDTAGADMESLAAHLAGLLDGSGKVVSRPRPPPPAPAPAPAPVAVAAAAYHHHHHHGAPVMEGQVLVAYGGGGPAAWPFLPLAPVQWQVPFVNGTGFFDPRQLAPAPGKQRVGGGGGTGVFLPRAQAYHGKPTPATKSPPAKDGMKAPKEQQAAETISPELGLPQEWTY